MLRLCVGAATFLTQREFGAGSFGHAPPGHKTTPPHCTGVATYLLKEWHAQFHCGASIYYKEILVQKGKVRIIGF